MVFNKNSYLSIENIKGQINLKNNVPNGDYKLEIKLVRVYDWYDESFSKECIGSVKDSTITFILPNGLERGLYLLLKIKSIDNIIDVGNDNDPSIALGAFTISGSSNKNSIELYKKIYNLREINFNKAKGNVLDSSGTTFHVFVFCKNILVSTRAQYDDVEIFPYDYLKCTSEVNYMNSFFKQIVELEIKEEKFNFSIPSSVFMIKNIKAFSYEEAEQYALDKIDIINNIFSLLLKSHGQYFATVTLNDKEHMSKINMLDTRYKGNLFLLADQGFNVLHYYRYISKNNSYLKVYLKLLNDAIKEDNRMMKYYRYWNILEGLAAHEKYDNNDMKNWKGEIVKNRKKQPIKIGDEALNTVFELFRQIYGNRDESQFINDLEQITTVKEFLSTCYQRRCCCAHLGECYKQDKSICSTKKSEKLCRENNIIHFDQPLGFQDKILRKLEDTTSEILMKKLSDNSGKPVKEDNIVNSIIA